jgi:acyl-coenzyme A synthetase/AMP-(fatty) acid ligase
LSIQKIHKIGSSCEIVVIPDGETAAGEPMVNVVSWQKFLDRGCVTDPTIDGCASRSYDDTAVIFWSSGTTGKPKGILHTQRYLIHTLQKTL